MKGDRRKVYLATAMTSPDGVGSQFRSFVFCSNAEGLDLTKEIIGRARTGFQIRNKPERGVIIYNIFCSGLFSRRRRSKCSK